MKIDFPLQQLQMIEQFHNTRPLHLHVRGTLKSEVYNDCCYSYSMPCK